MSPFFSPCFEDYGPAHGWRWGSLPSGSVYAGAINSPSERDRTRKDIILRANRVKLGNYFTSKPADNCPSNRKDSNTQKKPVQSRHSAHRHIRSTVQPTHCRVRAYGEFGRLV